MIVGFFLLILLNAIEFIVGLLPVYDMPTEIPSAITYFWSFVNLFSMVIPVGTIVSCMIVMTAFYGAEFLWNSAHWVLRRFKR